MKTAKTYKFSQITLNQISDLAKWLPAESATHAIEIAISNLHSQIRTEVELDNDELSDLIGLVSQELQDRRKITNPPLDTTHEISQLKTLLAKLNACFGDYANLRRL
ncbi:MAG: hypothetical protein JXM69_07880 [Anaerolineae bacterium]|nr:hypothetical protein [Anaerolineae bacterium]